MQQVSVKQLHEDNGGALALAWLAGRDGSTHVERGAAASAALIGHLNLNHPNRIQVAGHDEAVELERLAGQLFDAAPAALILADGIPAPRAVLERAERSQTPVFATSLPAARVIEKLARYLAKTLAERTERHGVFMDVLGLGVLITGDSGVGKSELGLELISRGHGLVADDVVELQQIGPETVQGRCPPLLRDFLEVRGLGVLNIRSIFGETAVRPRKVLRLMVHLETPVAAIEKDRLKSRSGTQDILGVEIPTVTLAVAPGRNLAVLVEAAVRNHILITRGIDSTREFIARQEAAMRGEARDEAAD